MDPNDPRHGTAAGYIAHYTRDGGNPCRPCRDAHNAKKRERYRLAAYGRWNPYMDAEPVREHVRSLMAQGIGARTIAKQSGVNRETISGLLWGKSKQPRSRRIRTESGRALLAFNPKRGYFVPTHGVTRRLRALSAMGYSSYYIADRLGVLQSSLRGLYQGTQPRTRATTFDTIEALFDELCMTPGPSNSAMIRARKKGWLPPLAWDDIDDPNEGEATASVSEDRYVPLDRLDETQIEAALRGQKVKLSPAERRVVVQQAYDWGWTGAEITERTGITKPERYGRSKRKPGGAVRAA